MTRGLQPTIGGRTRQLKATTMLFLQGESMSSGKPKSRTGVWFAVAVAAVLGLWFGGNALYTHLVILNRDLPRLEPGEVSLIGLKVPGYHIVVSNGVARLSVGDPAAFGKPESMSGASSGTTIPMKGL